jgi:hypothetical protein
MYSPFEDEIASFVAEEIPTLVSRIFIWIRGSFIPDKSLVVPVSDEESSTIHNSHREYVCSRTDCIAHLSHLGGPLCTGITTEINGVFGKLMAEPGDDPVSEL